MTSSFLAHCCHFGLPDSSCCAAFVVAYCPLMMLPQPLHIMRASSLLLLHLLIPPTPLAVCPSCRLYAHLLLRLPTSTRRTTSPPQSQNPEIHPMPTPPESLALRVAAVADNKGYQQASVAMFVRKPACACAARVLGIMDPWDPGNRSHITPFPIPFMSCCWMW